jgi:hypothetical protein
LEDPKKRPRMQEIAQMFEELNGQKGIQFTKSIQDYFDMLSKKFDPISRGHDLYIYYMIKLYLYII